VYIIVGLLTIGLYYFGREAFIDHTQFSYFLSSQLTFNLVIMFGLWGAFHSMIIKVKNPYWDKVILVLGFIVIVILLRLAGMKTIFG
jgi:hypothetical protein